MIASTGTCTGTGTCTCTGTGSHCSGGSGGGEFGQSSYRYLGVLVAIVPTALIAVWVLSSMGSCSGFGLSWATSTQQWRTLNWHPLLMTIAFCSIMSQALVAFKLLPVRYEWRKQVHMYMQAVTLILAAAGVAIVFMFKVKSGNSHLYSTHSWVGALTLLVFAIQFCIAATFFANPQFCVTFLPAHESFIRTVLPWHVMTGLGIFFGATLAMVTGVLNRQSFSQFVTQPNATHYSGAYIVPNFAALGIIAVSMFVFWVHRHRQSSLAQEDSVFSTYFANT